MAVVSAGIDGARGEGRDASGSAMTGREMEDEFVSIARSLGGDEDGRRGGSAYLRQTHALYHGGPSPWAFTPKIFDDREAAVLRDAAEQMGRIMEAVTARFVEDPHFRSLFALPPYLDRICQAPTGYSRMIPLARVDVFLNEETGDFQFCELNTDGSAGMTNTVEITRAIERSATWREFARRHPRYEAFDVTSACLFALLDTYAEWARGHRGAPCLAHPSLAVVDYADSVSADEVDDFLGRMRDLGIDARFSDVRDLRVGEWDGDELLLDDQGPIACVWRRAVTSELAQRRCAGVDALVDATQRGLVCTVGGFRTWPCATKTVFAVLRTPECRAILTPEQNEFVERHVPLTLILGAPGATDLARFSQRERWIVKPSGGYNSVGVTAGMDVTAEEWEERLRLGARDHDVIQAYAPQYATPAMAGILDGGDDPMEADPANNMEGLYLFNGRFCGVYTRCGRNSTIGEFTGRLNMGAFVVHGDAGATSAARGDE